jgi:hypothetical protein
MSRTNGPSSTLQAYSSTGFFRDGNSLLRIEFVKNAKDEVTDAVVYQNGASTTHPRTDEALPKQVAVQVAPALFDTYVGDYQLTPNMVLTVRREGNRFIGQATGQPPIELTATAMDTFFAKEAGAKVRFETAADGSVPQLILTQGGRDMPAKRIKNDGAKEVKEMKVAAAIFDTYVGKYELAPNFILTISRDGDRYLTQATGQSVIEISALGENVFIARSIPAQLKFEKAADGNISHVVLTQGGRDMTAKRMP